MLVEMHLLVCARAGQNHDQRKVLSNCSRDSQLSPSAKQPEAMALERTAEAKVDTCALKHMPT